TRSVGGELNTFALGFERRGFDERDHAARAARALGTRHHTLTITPSLFLEGVRDLAPLIDEPLADPAWVPTFLLSRFARSHVKTVLVGEGADELFAGYPTYPGGALAARYARLPAAVRRAVAAAAPALGAPQGNTTVRYLLRRFLEEADRPAGARPVPGPPAGRVRLPPPGRAQGAWPRDQARAAESSRRPGATPHPSAREARAHRAARRLARRPAPSLRARHARAARSPCHPARGGAHAPRRAR